MTGFVVQGHKYYVLGLHKLIIFNKQHKTVAIYIVL